MDLGEKNRLFREILDSEFVTRQQIFHAMWPEKTVKQAKNKAIYMLREGHEFSEEEILNGVEALTELFIKAVYLKILIQKD